MHSKKYAVVVNKPVGEVFAATLDPRNMPQWIDGIIEEQASDHPARLGTVYKNRGKTGGWSEYVMTNFEQDITFTLSRKGNTYHVKYTFKPIADNQTEFEYFEWQDEGKLDNPLPEEAIQKLKQLIENQ